MYSPGLYVLCDGSDSDIYAVPGDHCMQFIGDIWYEKLPQK